MPEESLPLTPGPAFQPGQPHIPVIIILSCPGRHEEKHGYPAAGQTGENLKTILYYANELAPHLFPSIDKFAYPIVNAWPYIEYPALTGRSEAPLHQLRAPQVTRRLEKALTGKQVAIALGSRAQYTLEYTNYQGKILKGHHPSFLSINRNYRSTAPTGEERTRDRLKQYTHTLLNQLTKTHE